MKLRALSAAIAALALTACAATGTTLAPAEHPTGTVHLTIAPMPAPSTGFPALAQEPTLPGVDPLALHVERVLGKDARATVGICVGATGAVDGIRLLRGSGMTAFDDAVVHDVGTWRFAAPAADAPTCEAATIVYRLR